VTGPTFEHPTSNQSLELKAYQQLPVPLLVGPLFTSIFLLPVDKSVDIIQ
jgi:hypothetical protein